MEKNYVFYDLQTGGYSAHTTLEGLADMLYQDLCSDVENYESLGQLDYYSWTTPERNRDLIEQYEYEILEATPENIKIYEKYHGKKYENEVSA